MENVEGLLLGEAWSYVQEIYRQFKVAGYSVKHWLCKGEYMGIPQTRHRVFFIALRDDIKFDLNRLDMSFNYERIPYGVIKSGKGDSLNMETQKYKVLCQATHDDLRIADVFKRIGEKERMVKGNGGRKDRAAILGPGRTGDPGNGG